MGIGLLQNTKILQHLAVISATGALHVVESSRFATVFFCAGSFGFWLSHKDHTDEFKQQLAECARTGRTVADTELLEKICLTGKGSRGIYQLLFYGGNILCIH